MKAVDNISLDIKQGELFGLLILGAASNVVIIQNAEKKGETLKFLEFARVGIPLTIICTFVYWAFLTYL